MINRLLKSQFLKIKNKNKIKQMRNHIFKRLFPHNIYIYIYSVKKVINRLLKSQFLKIKKNKWEIIFSKDYFHKQNKIKTSGNRLSTQQKWEILT